MQAAHSIRQFVEHGAVLLAPGAQNILSNVTHLMGKNLRQGMKGSDVVIADPDPVALVVRAAGDVEIRMFSKPALVDDDMKLHFVRVRKAPSAKRLRRAEQLILQPKGFDREMKVHLDKALELALLAYAFRGRMSNIPPTFPAGWHVFPCHPGSKKPIPDGWPQVATDDHAQISAWCAEYPGCNWAVACGPSNLAVIDIDGAEGEESFFALELDRGFLPRTRTHATPRGGRHLIFSGSVANSVGKLGNKVDTRGGNGYIIIPPSRFEGKEYACLDDTDPAPLPAFITEALGDTREVVRAPEGLELDRPGNLGRAKEIVQNLIDRGDIAIAGSGGDNLTYEVICRLRDLGLSADKIFEIITPWNDACQPPWDIDELRVKIENASRYAQNDAGAYAAPPITEIFSPDALEALLANAPTTSEPVREGRAVPKYNWMEESEFLMLQPPEWLIEDMLPRKGVGVIYGPSGHYKSFIALHIGATIAMQGECAFYVAAEGIARMATRDYPAWKMANGVSKWLPFYMQDTMANAMNGEDYRDFARSILAKAAGRKIGIIFLDTLNRAMLGLEENSAKEMAQMVEICMGLKKELGCTVVVIHHTPKDGTEPRGSGALYANVDAVLRVQADKSIKLARMYVTKQKNAEERPLPFCFEGKHMAGGLAFVPIDPKVAAALTDEAEMFSGQHVRKALEELNAFEPNWVSSRVLVGHVVPQINGETDAARADALAIGAKALTKAIATHHLDGFHEGKGQSARWSLPKQKD